MFVSFLFVSITYFSMVVIDLNTVSVLVSHIFSGFISYFTSLQKLFLFVFIILFFMDKSKSLVI